MNWQILQRDVTLDPHHKTSGTSSATKTGSTRQVQGQTGRQMQVFGRQPGETNASVTLMRRLV